MPNETRYVRGFKASLRGDLNCMIAFGGIDKLTCRRAQALPDKGLIALYVVARAHSECVF